MRYNFTAKNMVLSDSLKENTIKKINRLERLFPEDAEVYVVFSVVKLDSTIEITIPLQKRRLRAEVSNRDMYIALDEVVDILERQMVKYRKRIKEKARRDVSFKEELRLVPDGYDIPAESDDGEIIIDKTKKFAMKPIDAEEAVVEMEMLNHTFYVFRNRETDEVNVVYKRKNGTYGIIEPEN